VSHGVATWPEPVERIAAFLRTSGVEGRLEELPAGAESPPGPAVRAEAFESSRGRLVALVPARRTLDRERLARVARADNVRPAPTPSFPFDHARVFLDRSFFVERMVWLHVGSDRYALGLAPQQLAQVTRGQSAKLVVEDGTAGIADRGRG
jgi:prolyl-tRNA editing enzyme YbaK/EbsC (Cys-tRNA(Pro) deacylase)